MPNLPESIVVDGLFDRAKLLAERDWQPLREGVFISLIYDTGEDGPKAAFLHYLPGAKVPSHSHLGFEHIFVLHGAQSDENNACPAGSLMIHSPDSHHEVTSLEGCLVLAIWNKPVQFI